MPPFRDRIRNLFSSVEPLQPGIFHYQSPPDDPRNYRLHLRVESDGSGILIVNAATVLHLNQTATEYAYYLVKNIPEEEAVENIIRRYRVDRWQAGEDYQDFVERINVLINTPDLDPVTYLGFDRQQPFTGQVTAPYRLDCAITYRLPDGGNGTAPEDRVDQELNTLEWKTVINKAWQAGIPHLIFTGGEPTLRDDLPELIAHAEQNGQVTGLLSDGQRLADEAYLEKLLQAGLDHLMLLFTERDQSDWQALENALASDLFVAVHLTLTEETASQAPALLERLARMGVPAISLTASDAKLNSALQSARDQVAALDMDLVWNLPVPYGAHNPVALETNTPDLIEGAGRAWLYVEPDGDVLPAQGVEKILGNFLKDAWEEIWKGKSS